MDKAAFGALTVVMAVLWLLLSFTDTSNPVRSYVGFPPALVQQKATFLFGGDMMFDRSIRLAMERENDDHVFSCIKDLLGRVDLVVANLEGPITSHPSKSVGSEIGGEWNYTFTFPTSTAAMLARHNIRLVNLGNNHIMNFSLEGLLETKRWLDDADVKYFGDPDLGEEERVERMSIRGIPFSFANWSDWTSDKTDHTVAQVRKEVEAGRITIVYTHWGEEYEPPPARVRQLAHSFVDVGASLVVGSHPHIVQEHELYKGKYIYYSLGNFVFDQYWDESVRRGLLLNVTITPTGSVSVEEIPIDNQRDRRTCVAQGGHQSAS